MPPSWRERLATDWGWRGYLLAGAAAGVVACVWSGMRGDWGFGLVLLVVLTALAGPLAYGRSRARAQATEAGAAWSRAHPGSSARLRRVVLPMMLLAVLAALAAAVAELAD